MAEITTIARPYAQAVFKLAQETQALDAWADMLGFAAVVITDPAMAEIIDSPRLTETQLAELFIDVCGDKLNEQGQNFIKVLSEGHRLNVLAEVFNLYQQLKSEAEGAVQAELVTALPASDEQKATVLEALKKRFECEVELECSTDDSLVGGAIIRAGDLVIDGSVRGKLARLATALSH